MTPSDKPLLLVGVLAVLWLAQQSDRPRVCSFLALVTGLLAGFKWLGLFIAFAIAWSCGRRRMIPAFLILLSVGVIFGLSHLLWFPDWMIVYQFRQMRFGPPFHSGLAVLLQAMGLPMPQLYLPLMIASWALIQILHLRGCIQLPATIVFSILAILLWAPDTTAQMLFWLTLLVLLVVNWEQPAWIALVLVSTTWMTLMAAAAIGQVIPGLPVVDRLTGLSGPYGGIPLALWSHLPLALLSLRILGFLRYESARDLHRPLQAGP